MPAVTQPQLHHRAVRVLTSDIPEKAKVVRRPGGWLLVVQTGQVSEELADLLDELLGQYA